MTQPLINHKEVGLLLATRLQQFLNRPWRLVLALPHAGVEVRAMLSRQLNLPPDMFLTQESLNEPTG